MQNNGIIPQNTLIIFCDFFQKNRNRKFLKILTFALTNHRIH